MKIDDVYKDILEKYPAEKVMAFCVGTITKCYNVAIKSLSEQKPEIATGALSEANFYLNLLAKLGEKQGGEEKETIVVA